MLVKGCALLECVSSASALNTTSRSHSGSCGCDHELCRADIRNGVSSVTAFLAAAFFDLGSGLCWSCACARMIRAVASDVVQVEIGPVGQDRFLSNTLVQLHSVAAMGDVVALSQVVTFVSFMTVMDTEHVLKVWLSCSCVAQDPLLHAISPGSVGAEPAAEERVQMEPETQAPDARRGGAEIAEAKTRRLKAGGVEAEIELQSHAHSAQLQ